MTIKTIGQLATFDKNILISKLGKWGEVLQSYARGLDQDPVRKYEEREEVKSVGNSLTYYRDIKTDDDVYALLVLLSESVCARMKKEGFKLARTVCLTITKNTLESVTRMCKADPATGLSHEIADYAFDLFKKNFSWSQGLVRGLGVSVRDFTDQEQLNFCEQEEKREKILKLENAIENVRSRFGRGVINRGIVFTDDHMKEMNIANDVGALANEKVNGTVNLFE